MKCRNILIVAMSIGGVLMLIIAADLPESPLSITQRPAAVATSTNAVITWGVANETTDEALHCVVSRAVGVSAPTNWIVTTGYEDDSGQITALLQQLIPGQSYNYVESVLDNETGIGVTDNNDGQYYAFTTPVSAGEVNRSGSKGGGSIFKGHTLSTIGAQNGAPSTT